MAVDTREKRMNAARVGRPWMRARHAVGATDQQSRIASGHGYGGNALSPAGASTTISATYLMIGFGPTIQHAGRI